VYLNDEFIDCQFAFFFLPLPPDLPELVGTL
jgi:hypothetical protein